MSKSAVAEVIQIDEKAQKKQISALNKLVEKARASYGKDKSRAMQISTGRDISRPTKDSDFICWKNSPWETLTGIRGLPFGRISQIAGKPDSGKSSMASQFMKNAQDQGVLVILWDSENKFSSHRFDNFFKGDSNNMLITTSKMILQGAEQIERLITAAMEDDPDRKVLVIWDSVGGTLAKNEGDETNLSDSKQMAAAAKENKMVMRNLTRVMEKYKHRETNEEMIAVLLINQTYANIGAPGQKESGGVGVEYFSSIILQLSRKQDLTKISKGVKIKTGIVSRAKVKKNHLFTGEFSVSELDLTVSAGGIGLLSEKKIKEAVGKAAGWGEVEDGELEEESDEE
jgi:RecA/RadA recombinase